MTTSDFLTFLTAMLLLLSAPMLAVLLWRIVVLAIRGTSNRLWLRLLIKTAVSFGFVNLVGWAWYLILTAQAQQFWVPWAALPWRIAFIAAELATIADYTIDYPKLRHFWVWCLGASVAGALAMTV